MKKNLLLILPCLLLSACATKPTSVKMAAKADGDILSKTAEVLTGAIQIDATIVNPLENTTYTASDQIGDDARITSTTKDGVTRTRYLLRNSEGDTDEETLSLSNTIVKTTLDQGDTDKTPIDFDSTYGSPFQAIDASNIDDFFTAAASEDGYTLTPTAMGEGVLANALDHFYAFQDNDVWDSQTVSSYAENIVLSTDKQGVPTSIAFDHVKEDAYGGYAESITATIKAIDSVDKLTAYESALSAEDETILGDALKELGDKLNEGNFTQTIKGTEQAMGTYHSYYDLPYSADKSKGLGLMLSDYDGLSSDGVNHVYTGLGYGNYSTSDNPVTQWGYWACGVTPGTGEFGQVSNEFYPSIAAAVPTLGSMSPDFFTTTDGKVFEFQPYGNAFYNRTFAVEAMTALLGVGDYLSHIYGTLYVHDTTTMDYRFTSIVVDLTDPDTPTFQLKYVDAEGKNQTTTTSFSDFGTTDLENIPDAEADFKEGVQIAIENIFGGDNA